ncbi:MAG: hypothetical protein M1837_005308 [Sclerophora amabilis]|nr:MAG: hypothetical protein M1837_005308 [Sclerophora amabilis]
MTRPFPFLRLPRRLRCEIYRHLLPDKEEIGREWLDKISSRQHSFREDGEGCFTAILRANRLLYTEASNIMYERNFRFWVTPLGIRFGKRLLRDPSQISHFNFPKARCLIIEMCEVVFPYQRHLNSLRRELEKLCLVLYLVASTRHIRLEWPDSLHQYGFRRRPGMTEVLDRKYMIELVMSMDAHLVEIHDHCPAAIDYSMVRWAHIEELLLDAVDRHQQICSSHTEGEDWGQPRPDGFVDCRMSEILRVEDQVYTKNGMEWRMIVVSIKPFRDFLEWPPLPVPSMSSLATYRQALQRMSKSYETDFTMLKILYQPSDLSDIGSLQTGILFEDVVKVHRLLEYRRSVAIAVEKFLMELELQLPVGIGPREFAPFPRGAAPRIMEILQLITSAEPFPLPPPDLKAGVVGGDWYLAAALFGLPHGNGWSTMVCHNKLLELMRRLRAEWPNPRRIVDPQQQFYPYEPPDWGDL